MTSLTSQGPLLGYHLGEILGQAQGQIQTRPIGFGNRNESPNKSVRETSEGSLPLLHAPAEGHGMVIAGTGSGKGRSVAIPMLLTNNNPAIVLDIKGELHAVTAERRKQMGHAVYCLDFANLISKKGHRFNFFDLFKYCTHNEFIDAQAQLLADMMSFSSSGFSEKFWDSQGLSLNAAILACLIVTEDPKDWTLRNYLRKLFADDLKYSLAVMLDTVGKKIPTMAYQDIAAFLQLPDVTSGGVSATAQSYVKALMAEPVLSATDSSDFSLEDIREGKPMTVYIVFPPEYLSSHGALLRVWIGAMLKAITSRTSIPEKRTIFLLDEAAQLGTFNYLQTIITLCRGYGVSCYTFWQDLQQLKARYSDWQTLVNNCSTLQFFGCKNHLVAKGVEEITGIPAQRIAALPDDQQLVVMNGKNILSKRFDYLKDELFKGMYQPNPYYERQQGNVKINDLQQLGTLF
ncbi:type IV secretory system conjugative DNA transfer family protein [Runella salmonicolor]|uniref:Type IV secretory system conjugative DNA transfer family protein n=1 Tax=Runella salmonicolor TaxID=2950278 RepID=A0ABT1FX48_9BACT|nr:type IV secretory system conjugative DNA transfer family protein [Runella salmonicolor]MCP1386227.1 type IV secretory system conjugative DNA transfer family protein [Runella salmonicolor]